MKDKLENCFEGTRETPPRLLKKEQDVFTAERHLAKAEQNNFAMDLMFESGFFDWTIVCAYYAMYHAALASLWILGLEARSHECAIEAFEAFYVNRKKVDKRYVEYLSKAKELSERYIETLKEVKKMRVDASYGLGEVKSAEASVARSDSKEFVAMAAAIVSEAKGFGYQKVSKE